MKWNADILKLPPEFEKALKQAALFQLLTLLFASVLLDGGALGAFMFICVSGYWLGTIFIILRRRNNLKRTDLEYARWGFPAILVIGALVRAVTMIVGRHR